MNKTIEKLDFLKKNGIITDFELINVSEAGIEGDISKFGNHERLTLSFGTESLVINCSCSGVSENLTIDCS